MVLWQDFRYALRRLVKDRSLTLMAVAALGLGIGANATVFSLVHAVFIRGLPFEEPGRIVNVSSRDTVRGSTGASRSPTSRTTAKRPPRSADWRRSRPAGPRT